MKRRLILLPSAEQDLVDLADFIAIDSLGSAHKFLAHVRATADRLLRFPNTGRHAGFRDPSVSDLRICCVRRYRTYLILYAERDHAVEIVRVVHGARLMDDLLGAT